MSAPEPQDPRAPGPFAFAEKAWTTEILESAGFTNISITSLTPSLTVGQNLEEAMYFQARVGPLARAIAELDETVQLQAKQAKMRQKDVEIFVLQNENSRIKALNKTLSRRVHVLKKSIQMHL